MALRLDQMYCTTCEKLTTCTNPGTSAAFHLVLTLVTAGVWFIVWFIVAFTMNTYWNCSECGLRIHRARGRKNTRLYKKRMAKS